MKPKQLLTIQNAKTSKGESLGYLTGILYMAPSNLVTGINVCPFASAGCKVACLYTAGRGKFSNVQAARIKKTEIFRDDKPYFFESLKLNIIKLVKQANRKGLTPVVRLNGTSDISWENYQVYNGKNIFQLFPDVQFYDYTKNHTRLTRDKLPANYHLTFSWSEDNHDLAIEALFNGFNVAIVFSGEIPPIWQVFQVVNGDEHDLRFLDGYVGAIIGLKAKGNARVDKSGFVIDSQLAA